MLAIVIDSTSGLTRSEATELGVTVVPTYYSVDGHANEERFANECAGYESQLGADAMLHTEPAFPDAYLDAFSEALAKGDDVLCITLSSRLSAGHRSAEVARNLLLGTAENAGRIEVVDSHMAGAGLEILARRAREVADEGRDLPEVVAAVKERRSHIYTRFAVADMHMLRRSGRLSNTRRSVSATLDRFPVFGLRHGTIEVETIARGTAGMTKAMLEGVPQDVGRLYVAHYGEPTKALERLVSAIRRQLPTAELVVKDAGPVLTVNVGIGSVSLVWVDGE